jgi:hypothetical protein
MLRTQFIGHFLGLARGRETEIRGSVGSKTHYLFPNGHAGANVLGYILLMIYRILDTPSLYEV